MDRDILTLAWRAFNEHHEGTGTDEEARLRVLLDEATTAAS